MKLSSLKAGENVFIDANIFIYHFSGASEECREFLKDCEAEKFNAFTSTTVLAEVCHRLMMFEAVKQELVKNKQVAAQLQKKPEIVKKLSQYYAQITNVLSWNINIIPPPEDIFVKSQIYRSRFGLLTNDSFIPVFMTLIPTTNLASADKIFSSIPHLQLYSPSDFSL
jgi:predicted nucleic acid-binding protein